MRDQRRCLAGRGPAMVAQSWQERLDQRVRHLQQLRNEFADCVGCGCLSIDRCLMLNPDDTLGAHGSGPRRLLDE